VRARCGLSYRAGRALGLDAEMSRAAQVFGWCFEGSMMARWWRCVASFGGVVAESAGLSDVGAGEVPPGVSLFLSE
jgi:hypothetical protein